MPIEKADIETFLALAQIHPVFDARSPGEFKQAHIPGAYNLPLFSDEERKVVGTAYKQQSRQAAIKIGLDYFGVKMRMMIEEVERTMADGRWPMAGQGAIGPREVGEDLSESHPDELPSTANGNQPSAIDSSRVVLVHCWRGGMRSAAVAWLLDLYGFKVYTLIGGYKIFRRYVLDTFARSFQFRILGGFTGSGKTVVLKELANLRQVAIDLEALANHKGSAFGALGQPPQPSQEMFENLFALELRGKSAQNSADGALHNQIWLEDESQRIGSVTVPPGIWKQMRRSPVYFLDVPFEARLKQIEEGYGKLEKEHIIAAILRIQKRLGGMETKTAIHFLEKNNVAECFSILLKYYDKWYLKGLLSRANNGKTLTSLICEKVDEKENSRKLMRILAGTHQEKATKNIILQ